MKHNKCSKSVSWPAHFYWQKSVWLTKRGTDVKRTSSRALRQFGPRNSFCNDDYKITAEITIRNISEVEENNMCSQTVLQKLCFFDNQNTQTL